MNAKFTQIYRHTIAFGLIGICSYSAMAESNFKTSEWMLTVDENNGAIAAFYNGKIVLNHSVAHWGIDNSVVSFEEMTNIKAEAYPLEDMFGKGIKVIIEGKKDCITVLQSVSLYEGKDYVMTDFSVSSPKGITLNYMAPVYMSDAVTASDATGNHFLSVPYDNDAWVRYTLSSFGSEIPQSYEVAAVFNSDTRAALVVGSIEHDIWKTGVKAISKTENTLDSLVVFGGVTSDLTRDIRTHGAVKGNEVKSPKIFIGYFPDWRDGMETYADVCNLLTPQQCEWNPKPFGWNSWGKIQSNINFDNASQTSEFFSTHLQPNSFLNEEATVCVGLDSFWDCGMTEEERIEYARLCHSRGQKAGIYWCPFTDWIKDGEHQVVRTLEYKYKDCYLYHDGEILNFDGAYALDPTHPAVKKRIEQQLNKFIEWGYDFVKIDFMAHGAYEADSHFDKDVMTGVQAYNQGMAFIDSVIDNRLWINLSIAPLFPAHYAHSRRIGCDAWADIKNTEYTLNALTYGWWLDRLYHYNDADHIVMEGVTEGENRARLTSSAITGLFILGDDLSESGTEETKSRVLKIATNPDINEMARKCKSFRPVEHGIGDSAADMFYYQTDDVMYVAAFNFSDTPTSKKIDLSRLGLQNNTSYYAEELWAHEPMSIETGFNLDIPAKDVKVLRIQLDYNI